MIQSEYHAGTPLVYGVSLFYIISGDSLFWLAGVLLRGASVFEFLEKFFAFGSSVLDCIHWLFASLLEGFLARGYIIKFINELWVCGFVGLWVVRRLYLLAAGQ